MNRAKILLGIGVLAILMLVLFAVASLVSSREDPAQIAFAEALGAQSSAVALSSLALEKSADQDVRQRASSITATIGSDLVTLTPLYEKGFSGSPGAADQAAIDETAQLREGFDQLYREQTLQYLLASRERLEYVQSQANGEELQAALKVSLKNHQVHITDLTSQ